MSRALPRLLVTRCSYRLWVQCCCWLCSGSALRPLLRRDSWPRCAAPSSGCGAGPSSRCNALASTRQAPGWIPSALTTSSARFGLCSKRSMPQVRGTSPKRWWAAKALPLPVEAPAAPPPFSSIMQTRSAWVHLHSCLFSSRFAHWPPSITWCRAWSMLHVLCTCSQGITCKLWLVTVAALVATLHVATGRACEGGGT